MLHFPSQLPKQSANGIPRRSDSLHLNATQQRSSSNPIFLKIEEELHDARRVHSDGQEDDLRYALNMVINRVSELSALLSEAYKNQADLEVQLNVAKSNLQLVIANNEMLEDALKRDTTGQSKDVGWRRTSGRDGDVKNPRASLERSQSVEYSSLSADPSPPPSAGTPTSTQDNRFFKFRFNNPSTTNTRPASRPETPSGNSSQAASPHIPGVQPHHLNSPSMPSLSSVRSKELEDLTVELEKERAARKSIAEEKTALENELESLSQALFEEANKMVADERKMRAETEEELKELKLEKEALRSALRLVDGENTHLRESGLLASPQPQKSADPSSSSFSRTHSRSSSEIAIKSRPQSLNLASPYPPLPPSPSPDGSSYYDVDESPQSGSTSGDDIFLSPTVISPEEESQPTPRFRLADIPPTSQAQDDLFMESSPWADVPSKAKSTSPERRSAPPSMAVTAGYAGIR